MRDLKIDYSIMVDVQSRDKQRLSYEDAKEAAYNWMQEQFGPLWKIIGEEREGPDFWSFQFEQ